MCVNDYATHLTLAALAVINVGMQFLSALVLVLGLVGCGPSNAQMRSAKTTVYKLPGKSMLDLAIQVAQIDYKVSPGGMEIDALKFSTDPQWYNPEGGRISPSGDATGGEWVNAGGGDVNVQLVVQVRPISDDTVAVEVTAHTLQLVAGSPQPRELTMDDPNLPPWIHGRVDTLAYSIYEHGKQYAVAH